MHIEVLELISGPKVPTDFIGRQTNPYDRAIMTGLIDIYCLKESLSLEKQGLSTS